MTRKTLKLLSRAEARRALKKGCPIMGIYEWRVIGDRTYRSGIHFGASNEIKLYPSLWKSCHAFVLWPEKEGKR